MRPLARDWWMFLPIFWPLWALVCFYWSWVILTEH